MFGNREKYFRIEKTISESRKLFQNREKCFTIEKYFVARAEKSILNSMTLNSMNLRANIYLFKVNNWNTKKRCEICSKSMIKTAEWRQWHHSYIFIVNFEHIPHLHCFYCYFEQLNVSWALFITQDKRKKYNKSITLPKFNFQIIRHR